MNNQKKNHAKTALKGGKGTWGRGFSELREIQLRPEENSKKREKNENYDHIYIYIKCILEKQAHSAILSDGELRKTATINGYRPLV